MDLSIGSLFLAALATILLSLLIRNALPTRRETRARLPPGPWNLPIVGSLHHLVGSPPHRALLHLARRHGPLMLLQLGEVPTVIVSSPEAAMEVMKINDPIFASRPRGAMLDVVSFGGKGLILAPYGAHWRQMRKVCMVELLSTRQVRHMERIRQSQVSSLIESIFIAATSALPTAVVNLSQGLTELTNNVIARAVFSGKCQQQQEYLLELAVGTMLVGGFSLADLFPSSRLAQWLSGTMCNLRRSHNRIQDIISGIILERKEKQSPSAFPGFEDEDLLDVLLRLQEEDSLAFPLTAEIISAVIYDIFGAATDTTAATLEWAMAELIRNPQAMSRATSEIRERLGQGIAMITSTDLGDLRYLRMVIKETLRLHPAVPLILRASQEKCKIMGYEIPKGTSVFINTFAVASDPSYWDNTEEFKPERFENSTLDYNWTRFEFIPFGAGRRQCPGALFATMTIELTLANLLYHFDWALPDGADPKALDMGEVFGVTVRRRSNLCMLPALHLPH
ncbi:unnamed protein product [Urochloa decumbens]|uniref:Cytochrome P450 n=1 Tax=Urochloa decumbens TaxID=240449 RepID=A0ABC8XCD0_9POAL